MHMKFSMEPSRNTEEMKVLSSKPELAVKKFTEWIVKKGIDPETLANEDVLAEMIAKSRVLHLGVTLEEVIAQLKNEGFISEPAAEKIEKISPKPSSDVYRTYQKLTRVENEELQRVYEENMYFLQLEKDIFKDEKDLDAVLEQALSLKNNAVETEETEDYYYEFTRAGLIKGGEEEVRSDLKNLRELKEIFKKKNEVLEKKKAERVEKAKKVATIIERTVAYCVSDLGWFGDTVSLEPTSQFDDFKRRVDEVLEIRKEDEESSFLGLGIDVTYLGLHSMQYKEKFFKLLRSLKKGQATRIKYFKNHKGELMEEFAVPKIILSFDIEDVKKLIYLVKNNADPKVKERLKKSPLKLSVLGQVISACEILADFAEECGNPAAADYDDIIASIRELGEKNPEIQQMLNNQKESATSSRMTALVEEFNKADYEIAEA